MANNYSVSDSAAAPPTRAALETTPLIYGIQDDAARTARASDVQKVSDRTGGAATAGEAKLSKEFPSSYVLAGAFASLKGQTGIDLTKAGTWNAKNAEQQYLATQLPGAANDLSTLPSAIKISGAASVDDPTPVNEFLKKNGMDIQLQKGDKDSLYMAGTASVEDTWRAKAKNMETDDGQVRPSIYKDGKVHEVNNQSVAEIHSSPDMRVYAIPLPKDKQNMSGVDVQKYAQNIVGKIAAQEKAGLDGEVKKVEFPMVDLNSKQDLTGLIGMQTKDGKISIDQAKMQTELQMDEHGFKAKQGVAAQMTLRSMSMDPPAFQIKDRFIVAVATPSGQLALATQVDYADMKRPSSN